MPVITNKDEKGCYAQWGEQTKYYYECGNEQQRLDAMKKASIQGIAIQREQGKLKREEKNQKVKEEQNKRIEKIKIELKKEKDRAHSAKPDYNKHKKK